MRSTHSRLIARRTNAATTFRSAVSLRERRSCCGLAPTRNNQRLGIHWAEDFEFGATLGRDHGAIAQLGERRAGSAKVAGSSPAGSIPEPADGGFASEAGRLFGEWTGLGER